MRLHWDGVVDRGGYSASHLEDRDNLSNSARAGAWHDVLQLLHDADRQLSANHWRLGGSSWFTPLHQAAWQGAPEPVVRELIALGASRTLTTADGETAHDIAAARGHHPIAELLEPETRNPAPAEVVTSLERNLADLVEGRIRPELSIRLRPFPVAVLTERDRGTPAWFPVPGMYGGFQIRLETSYLDVKSWSRVVDGSGQAHVITTQGVVLVAEGFV